MKIPISEPTEHTSATAVIPSPSKSGAAKKTGLTAAPDFNMNSTRKSPSTINTVPQGDSAKKTSPSLTQDNGAHTARRAASASTNHSPYCTRATAEKILSWAAGQHGGGWVGHSRTAARVAETIAKYCNNAKNQITTAFNSDYSTINNLPIDPNRPSDATNTPSFNSDRPSDITNTPSLSSNHPLSTTPLDPDRAYVYALLHDIGRYEGNTMLHHIIAGYKLLMEAGYPNEARICLTHSCYSMKLAKNPSYWPGIDNPTELRFLVNFINTVKFNDYDRLIQLADLMSLDAGVFSINDRFCDSVSRYRLSDPQEDLRARQALKTYFDQKTGLNIYSLFSDEIARHALNQ